MPPTIDEPRMLSAWEDRFLDQAAAVAAQMKQRPHRIADAASSTAELGQPSASSSGDRQGYSVIRIATGGCSSSAQWDS
jgi:hypothetical protein